MANRGSQLQATAAAAAAYRRAHRGGGAPTAAHFATVAKTCVTLTAGRVAMLNMKGLGG